jgi:hypothetical protein
VKLVDAASGTRLALPLRLEDLVMAGWVAIASPILFRIGGDKGPFDPGQPVPGLLRLASVVGVLVCIAARQRPEPGSAPRGSMISRGAVGPFVGGLLLVTIAGFTALNAQSQLVLAVLVVAGVGMVVVRFVVPPLGTMARRALVSPFVVIAGGLYWTFIESVIRPSDATALRNAAVGDLHAATPILLFLAAFSIVYYAMLIYAPRQIAEREGGWIEWLLRYAAFVVSIAFGIGWLGILSG